MVSTECICRLGKSVAQKCRDYRDADETVDEWIHLLELRMKRINTEWTIVQKLWRPMDGELRKLMTRHLEILRTKLYAAEDKITMPQESKRVKHDGTGTASHGMRMSKKLKFVSSKSFMQELIDEVDSWLKDFDLTWFFTAMMATPAVDEQIASVENGGSGVDAGTSSSYADLKWLRDIHNRPDHHRPKGTTFIPAAQLKSGWKPIPSTAVFKAKLQLDTRHDQRMVEVILDSRTLNDEAMNRVERDVQQIAEDLGRAHPRLGLLKCLGVIKRTAGNGMGFGGFDMLFEIPQGLTEPQSLRHLLCPMEKVPEGKVPEKRTQKRIQYSVNQRLHLARQLSKSVMILHHFGFVHKNISPYSTILFKENEGQLTPFLLGFNKFRHNQQETNRTGDNDWWRNLYRHPERQGTESIQRFIMQHDIYSLGVCLVEIGLWTSFVLNESVAPKEGPMLKPFKLLDIKDLDVRARVTHDKIINLAREELPAAMGDIYADVVISCLTCLDEANDFGKGEDVSAEDKIQIGVAFMNKVRLMRIPRNQSLILMQSKVILPLQKMVV